MLIYNTTFHVEEAVLQKFLCFVKDVYFPAVTEGGYLTHPRLVHLMSDVGDKLMGYAIMADCPGEVMDIKRWRVATGDKLIAQLTAEFGTKVLTFSTAMKVIKE